MKLKKKQKRKKWMVFAKILLAIQVLASIMLFVIVCMTKMVPVKFLIPIAILLIFAGVLVFGLVYYGQNRKKIKKMQYVNRGLGTFISVFTISGCIFGSSVLGTVLGTLNDMTEKKELVEETIAVYVLADDAAKTIEDAKAYKFAYSETYGAEDAKETIEDINSKVGAEIVTENHPSVIEMVDSLYAGNVQAIILNESYESVVSETEGYEDFTSRTRILYEYTRKYEKVKEEKNVKVKEEPFVVYLSGSDTRNAKLAKSRSDVNILAVVHPKTRQVLLISTPRDYYVETTVSNGSKDKLTHCGLYGIECSMGTLADIYGLDKVDYYTQINFTGFETLIDEIGGITVESDATFTSSDYPDYKYVKGPNSLNGSQALAFVRERYNLPDGDNARGRHQMAMISAVIDKVTGSTALLTNYSGIMDSLEGMVSMDFESDDISSLVNMQLSEGGGWNIKSYAVTGEGASKKTYSMPKQNVYVCIPDETSVEKAKGLIQKVMNGETITDEDVQ